MNRFLPVVCVLPAAALASPSRADVPNPDRHYVTHRVIFTTTPAVRKQYRLFVVAKSLRFPLVNLPVPASGEVNFGELGRYVSSDPLLYAVPRSLPARTKDEPNAEWFSGKTPGVLHSEPLVRPVRDTEVSDPHDTYRTRYKVEIKETKSAGGAPAHTLLVTRMEDGWLEPTRKIGQTGFLLGIPAFACLGLVGRLKSRRRDA